MNVTFRIACKFSTQLKIFLDKFIFSLFAHHFNDGKAVGGDGGFSESGQFFKGIMFEFPIDLFPDLLKRCFGFSFSARHSVIITQIKKIATHKEMVGDKWFCYQLAK